MHPYGQYLHGCAIRFEPMGVIISFEEAQLESRQVDHICKHRVAVAAAERFFMIEGLSAGISLEYPSISVLGEFKVDPDKKGTEERPGPRWNFVVNQ